MKAIEALFKLARGRTKENMYAVRESEELDQSDLKSLGKPTLYVGPGVDSIEEIPTAAQVLAIDALERLAAQESRVITGFDPAVPGSDRTAVTVVRGAK